MTTARGRDHVIWAIRIREPDFPVVSTSRLLHNTRQTSFINQLSFPLLFAHCVYVYFACVVFVVLLLSHVLRSGVFYVGFCLAAVPLPQYITLSIYLGILNFIDTSRKRNRYKYRSPYF